MVNKQKKTVPPKTETFPRRSPSIEVRKSDSEEVIARKLSAFVTSPEMAASRAINASEKYLGKDIDLPTLTDELGEQAAVVNRGDLSRAEAMLMN